MSIPDFDRAEYVQPAVIEGYAGDNRPGAPDSAFLKAMLFGAVAAIVGGIGYGLVASLGFMISIIAIGIGWIVAKAMMTATGGFGGRPYQIAAVVMTYFAVSGGELLHPLWKLHQRGVPVAGLLGNPVLLKYFFLGPFLELTSGLNGILGVLILFFGLRAAWQFAAGTPGFGQTGGRRIGPFGMR